MVNVMKYKLIASPVGPLKIIVDDHALRAILWENDQSKWTNLHEAKQDPLILEVEKQLKQYFEKKRTSFTLPLHAQGTPFQEKVWQLLCKIPFGSTWSYKDIAEKIDNPKAVRAVGGAIGKNPISIVIPCHRVIGASGSLTGFAGGLERKKMLLDLEG